ncbi:MAG: AAA family ATPase [Chlamydiae bacterium]|nr:AAA family ATPase [Chlamydiota bacterium]MBI3277896.1 AAA family ATPase [Chlamydiota bacterium]
MTFYGREDEIRLLREPNFRPYAQLIVVYGRRRVGKTALIEEAYQKEVLWKFEGLEAVSVKIQIKQFIEQLSEYSGDLNLRRQRVEDWRGAFALLFEKLKRKKVVVFLDEFQWLVQMKPQTVSLFKYFWDNSFSKCTGCRFILCGSISSFIVKKIIKSKALYGRVDTEINLQPLKLKEIRAFLPQRSEAEVLDFAMTFGGIPKYLLEINPRLSYLQNLNEYAFSQSGYFFQEFQRLFLSHFAKSPHYEKVIVSLVNQILSTEELARCCGVSPGGTFSQVLEDLSLAGFIQRDQPLDLPARSKVIRYRLLDEYLNFYFSFIAQNRLAIQKGQFLFPRMDPKRMAQWQGYAFERLCRRHSFEIATALRFSGIGFKSGSWFRSSKRNGESAQIDLLFQRQDKVLTLCEIKYVQSLSGQKMIRDLENKIKVLQKYFPSYGIQKVLLLGRKISVGRTVHQAFDEILFAPELFF